jgi:hypothetical protein
MRHTMKNFFGELKRRNVYRVAIQSRVAADSNRDADISLFDIPN